MENSSEQFISTQLSVFLTVALGFSILCCLLFNTRLAWLIARRLKDGRAFLHLSPYLLSSCISETVITCVFGPVLCILMTQQTWKIGTVVCTFLDCLFLALLWSATASTFVYSMDRHCLLVQRRLYPETFGNLKRNAVNLAFIWVLSLISALPYIVMRNTSAIVPMTFTFEKNMTYCAHAVVILYTVPVLITAISLIKTVRDAKMRKKAFHQANSTNEPPQIHKSLIEEFQTYEGLVVSSCIFILTSLPWVWFQLLKALDLTSQPSVASEIILMAMLVFGVGTKTGALVLCSACIREKFFSSILRRSNSREYNLEPLPVVLTNVAAV